jgi:arginase family enzyme
MNFEDCMQPPPYIETEPWQLGSLLTSEIEAGTVVLIFVSDCRGSGYDAESVSFLRLRKKLYRLSQSDFKLRICDLGDLISGNSLQDTHFILQQILLTCHQKKAIPVVLGGGVDLSYSLFSALNEMAKSFQYTQITNTISLQLNQEEIDEKNYMAKLLTDTRFQLGSCHFLGIQRHLQEKESLQLLQAVDFEIIPLSAMMNATEKAEPYFRRAELVTINCDAIESFAEAFSLHPQVNGLNKREVCAYMKEIGMSESLKSVGVFNYNIYEKSHLNEQLMAQMLWYLLEGINIRQTHPKTTQTELEVPCPHLSDA